MRPYNPIVKILRDYVNYHLDNYFTGNIINCYNIIYWLFSKKWYNYFSHTYKSCRRIKKINFRIK